MSKEAEGWLITANSANVRTPLEGYWVYLTTPGSVFGEFASTRTDKDGFFRLKKYFGEGHVGDRHRTLRLGAWPIVVPAIDETPGTGDRSEQRGHGHDLGGSMRDVKTARKIHLHLSTGGGVAEVVQTWRSRLAPEVDSQQLDLLKH